MTRLPLAPLVAIAGVFIMPDSRAASVPDAARVLERLETARAAVKANGAEAAAGAWQAFARDHPVAADWAAQDLGGRAGDLVVAERAAAAVAALADAAELGTADRGDEGRLWQAYLAKRTARRAARLSELADTRSPVVFTEAHTFEMSFIGYTEGLSDARAERFFRPGTRLTRLDFPAGSTFAEPRVLIDDPHGMMRDADVSFDGKRVLFAWKKSDRLDDYHLYEHDLTTNSTRQITRGLGRADYEPVYLPDGDIVFASTRPEQSVPCWWTEISNLYRADAQGNGLRRLAIDQVHTLYPQLMSDGRLTYTRWDYSDRGQNFSHPLFSMRPDGRDQRAFYGANSWFPNSLLHARGIPGSHEVVAVASGHHTRQQGKLVIIDNRQGRDEGKGMRFIAPVRDVPYERVDRAMQQGDQFRYPYPLGGGTFLASFRPEHGVPGFGLYWIHEDGSRELLHRAHDLETGRPVPAGRRPAVAKLAEEIDFDSKTALYHVHDVYQGTGLAGVKRGEARWIRVVRLEYRAAGVGKTHNRGEDGGSLNSSPVGIANTSWDVKEILGDADIHADGSALFEVPAMQSIYLQVIDARGRVIQTTRSWDTLRPGETKGCAGCHDKTDGNHHPFHDETTLAWKHGPQKLLHPFEGRPRGFSFPQMIQPILDAKCVSCHDGTDDVMDLRGTSADGGDNLNKRAWSVSYLNLLEARKDARDGNWTGEPDKGLVRWIQKQSRPTEIPPRHSGAARSPLIELLENGHYEVELDDREWFKLAAWIDLLVPFSGDYREGGAWSGRDHAFYTYYETKRARHREEEERSVRDWLKRHGGGNTDDAPGPLTARYRVAIEDAALAASGDGSRNLSPAHPQVMTDRLSLRSEDDVEVIIHGTVAGKVLASTRLSGGAVTDLPLAMPTRSDRLRIETKPPGAPVRITGIHGVTPGEIPTVDGFHPFLGKELRDAE
jgi:hypothetical protein